MRETVFAGDLHKITTDGKAFFLYRRSSGDAWELRDTNSVGAGAYKEVLEDLKKILSADMKEEEKILRICESGFFRVSNL